jgi:hypothetical protein
MHCAVLPLGMLDETITLQALGKGAGEYEQFYKVELKERKAAGQKAEADKLAADLERMEADIAAGRHGHEDVMIPP